MKNTLWSHGDIFYLKHCRIETFNRSRQCTESTKKAEALCVWLQWVSWKLMCHYEFRILQALPLYVALLTFVLERNPCLKVKSFTNSQPSISVSQSVSTATVSVSLLLQPLQEAHYRIKAAVTVHKTVLIFNIRSEK